MFKSIIKKVLPFIGGAIGGPIGAVATKAVASILLPDKENPTEDELANAYANATPVQLEKIKSVVSLAQIEADDRKNARDRQLKTNDSTPRNVTYIFCIAFIFKLFMPYVMPNAHIDANLTDVLCDGLMLCIGFFVGSRNNK